MDIFEASKIGSLNEVKRFLKEGIDVDLKNDKDSQWTALFYACRFGHLELVHFLLTQGADPNVQSFIKLTPLMIACKHNYFKIVKLLLNAGANPALTSLGDYTALDFALELNERNTNIILLFQRYFHLLEKEDRKFIQNRKYRFSFAT